uniref:Ig-like domain-containing protein n=1 Tax=Maylandia zebra TaxID=106582 RepID=A0A3P9DBR4_9CICH
MTGGRLGSSPFPYPPAGLHHLLMLLNLWKLCHSYHQTIQLFLFMFFSYPKLLVCPFFPPSLSPVFPSVSLLQKTPSSPVSCHATGFYPDRAEMFWSKDGEQIHEGVDHREILPNNDETFQMSVDLNVSSVTPEDWQRYDCVFQLSGVNEDMITKLDKTVVKTNWGKNKKNNNEERASDIVIPIIAAVILLVLILFSAVGVAVCKKKKEKPSALSSGNISELSERLNGDAT